MSFWAFRTLNAWLAVVFAAFAFAAFGAGFALAALAIAAIAVAPATSAAAEIAFAALTVELLLLLFARREIDIRLIGAVIARGLGFAIRFGALGAALFALEVAAFIETLRLRRRRRRLHRAHETEIMVGVLGVVFAQNAIAGAGGVAGKLQIALVNVRCGTAHLHFRA